MNQLLLRRHLDTLLAIALAFTVFCVYLRTLCPTVYWGDCAELATVVVTMGIPHPTGYPLYCLLGKAWTLLLPMGSLVWRLNVMSAFFGALAVACCYGFARALALPRPLALMAAGLLAFTYTFWQQCLITETYSLAAFFTCLLLFLAARWKANGQRPKDLRLFAVAYGFTLTSHQTNTLFLPGFIAFILWSAPALRNWKDKSVCKEWAKTLGMGALPLLTYLYLPLRARMHPAYNWGDVETPFAFFYHVTGQAYSQWLFYDPLWKVKGHFLTWMAAMPMEFSWPLVALCILGLALFWQRREDRPLALLLTWIVTADVVFALNYSIYNAYIYFIPCYIVMSVCAGRSLLGLWAVLEPHLEAKKRPAYAAFGALCVLALIPVQALSHQ
ncbi:MAG: protein O-mannosyl-transferase family [Janthinobacterium lividum]